VKITPKQPVRKLGYTSEFGHVEDAAERSEANKALIEASKEIAKKTRELGSTTKALADTEVVRKRQKAFKLFGVTNPTELTINRDRRAERTAIPVVRQSFVNKGKRVPKNVRRAIESLNK